MRADEKTRVAGAVAALPDSLRQPVLLYYYEELPIDEIAAVMGLGRENIKSRLHRSRKILKQKLEFFEDFDQKEQP